MSVRIRDYDVPKRCAWCIAYFAGLCNLKKGTEKCPIDGVPEWCPIEEDLPRWNLVDDEIHPADGEYILISFENFSKPLIGEYEETEEGGTYYVGGVSCISKNLIVNAWMPLPEPYREPEELTEEMETVSEHCKHPDCIHRMSVSAGGQACRYIYDTGHVRGCKISECDKYESAKGKRRGKKNGIHL